MWILHMLHIELVVQTERCLVAIQWKKDVDEQITDEL